MILIYPRKALSANLGHQSNSIWATETIGFDVTYWRKVDDCEVPEMSKFCQSESEAKALAKSWKRFDK